MSDSILIGRLWVFLSNPWLTSRLVARLTVLMQKPVF